MHLIAIALFLFASKISALVHSWIGEPGKQTPDPKQPNWWMKRHVDVLLTQSQYTDLIYR
jgi:hypothetical protein